MADDKADPKVGPLEPGAPVPLSLSEEIARATDPAGESALPETAATLQKLSIEPTDDSPTMISRKRQAPEEAITNSLRGRKLAHFDLEEPIGVGGMGAVIRARDTQLDRIVALKILPPHLATDPENIRRFQREARAAAKLDHENIARVFFFGEDQGLHFIAFEYVEGDNLRAVIDRKGRLPVVEAIHCLLQVAAGLAHASSRGVVHRDIKPSNIILTPTGRAKLVDMGLARSLEPHTEQLTQSGVTLGTFDYVSPEQALEPGQADVRSDIYSLGCTFYHMLTGQPPVPEGTVAKKLHFHEHGLPIDPRQINAEIPDEVAAVLARMMAKNPKERYQRAEHLVQHLLQIAQKLGGQVPAPEGVLFVDAPLPNPPRNQPIVVGVLATALVVGLVLFLGSMGGAPHQPDTGFKPFPIDLVKGQGAKNDTKIDPVNPGQLPKVVQVPNAAAKAVVVQNSKDLVDAFKQPVSRIALGADRFDLKREEGATEIPGLVFQGEELVIQPEDGVRRPVIRLDHYPVGKDQLWAALSIHSGKVTIRGVRFVINAHATETAMCAVLVREGTLTLENCEFVQEGLAEEPEQRHVSSVQVAAALPGASARPSLVIDRCFFPGGHQALLLNGSATADLVNCAFGPHSSLLHVHKVQQDAEVSLRSCSAFLPPRSAAFLLTGGASCNLKVDNSLFASTAAEPVALPEGPVLVRQTGERAGEMSFVSRQRNVYACLAAFWARESSRGQNPLAATLDEFKQAAGVALSSASVALNVSPWQNKNLDMVATRPELAFAVNGEFSDLRQADIKKVVGVQRCTWGDLYFADFPQPKERRPDLLARRTKTVNPKMELSGNGVYPTLGQALGEAQPDDVILIQHNGEMRVDALRLNKVRGQLVDVTIRPDQGFKPVLVLGDTSDKDAALFRLHDGNVTFEDLEFRLTPEGPFETISVVTLVGEGQCVFKRCVVTLEETKKVQASLVTLADLSTVMAMDPAPARDVNARLRFEECFIRGDGDLVTVKASRPFSLDLKECLVVLEGSVLVVEPNAKDVSTRQAVQITLDRVTTYLSDHLFLLRAGKDELKTATGLVPIHVGRANHCLFASKGTKTLVHVRGVDSEAQIKNLLTWDDGKDNVYSSYSYLLDQVPRADGVMPLEPFDQGKWGTFAHETGRFTKVKFAAWPPPADRPLTRAQPVDFVVKEPPVDAGAGVSKLPRPSPDPEPAATSSSAERDYYWPAPKLSAERSFPVGSAGSCAGQAIDLALKR